MTGKRSEVALARTWSSRSLTRLGWLLPLAALTVLVLLVFAVSRDRHVPASDLDTGLVVVALAAVPITGVAGIVLAVLAIIRARSEDAGLPRRSRLGLLAPIVVAILCVGFTAGLVWATLELGAAFR
jgi:hypothetical protein